MILDGHEYDLTWYGAWTLGTLVSITDPNEAIETLKEINASHKFITLMEFESLINDGTGIIFFNFLASLARINSHATITLSYVGKNIIY